MAKLYKICGKEYRFAQIATVKMNTITNDEFTNLSYGKAKTLWSME